MAILKAQLLINWKDVAGWSEIFYRQISDGDVGQAALVDAAITIANRRALVLTPVARIIGVRATNVAFPRVTFLQRTAIQGQNTQILSSSGPDVVNVGILSTLNSDLGGKRQFIMRGLLDDDVINGEITLAQSGQGIFTSWYNFLGNGSFRIRDLQPGFKGTVTEINGTVGQVSTPDAPNFAAGDLVTISTRSAGNGKRIRWTGKVLAVGPLLLQLVNYKWGNATGGTVTKQTVAYGVIGRVRVPFPQRARTRQTGRPFDLLRGRQTKR